MAVFTDNCAYSQRDGQAESARVVLVCESASIVNDVNTDGDLCSGTSVVDAFLVVVFADAHLKLYY